MEILITGGNGFLGRNLILALQERGDNVRVLALSTEDTTWLEKRDVAVFRGDILNPDALIAPMRGVEGMFPRCHDRRVACNAGLLCRECHRYRECLSGRVGGWRAPPRPYQLSHGLRYGDGASGDRG